MSFILKPKAKYTAKSANPVAKTILNLLRLDRLDQNNNKITLIPTNLILDKKFLIRKINDLNEKIIDQAYINYTIIENNNEINVFFDNKEVFTTFNKDKSYTTIFKGNWNAKGNFTNNTYKVYSFYEFKWKYNKICEIHVHWNNEPYYKEWNKLIKSKEYE
mgnify:CR=1 FL=1